MKEPYQLSFRFKRPKRWERIGGIAFDLGAFATILLFALWLIGALIGPAHAHDHYTAWKQPDNGGSCCNDQDCRPVTAKRVNDRWQVWISELKRWETVPENKVLDPAKFPPPDGSFHGCYTIMYPFSDYYTDKPTAPMPAQVLWYCFNPGRTDF